MASSSFWSDACQQADGRPLRDKLNGIFFSFGFTVNRYFQLHLAAIEMQDVLTSHLQIGAFCASGAASFYMFSRWNRLDNATKGLIWPL
jgi:hypothetical protein